MKCRKILPVLLIAFLAPTGLYAQETMTLAECIEKASANHKLAMEKERYAAISDLSSQILRKAWMPVADLGASFVYNSDVVDLAGTLSGIPVPGLADFIPPVPHSHYRVTMELSQLLYDGGVTGELVRQEEAALRINQKITETDIYAAGERVISTYFGIVLLDEQYRLINTFIASIESQMVTAASAVRSGVLTPSDHDILLAEKLKLELQGRENRNLAVALRNILGEITATDIRESTRLITGEEPVIIPINGDIIIKRPEIILFDLTISKIEAGEKLIAAARRPKAYGFATLGYGKPPGNNFFSDSSEPFIVTGATLRWNIHDWNISRREREILNVRREIAGARKSDMEEKFRLSLERKRAEIESIRESVAILGEIAAIRGRVSETMSSRLRNGTITASEYIVATNPEREVLINLEIQKINLVKAGYEFLFLTGSEIK